jgi:hypothetical protein
MSIPELLINDGFITAGDREEIEKHSAASGLSFIKIALTLAIYHVKITTIITRRGTPLSR